LNKIADDRNGYTDDRTNDRASGDLNEFIGADFALQDGQEKFGASLGVAKGPVQKPSSVTA